jgi:hypothetical protein
MDVLFQTLARLANGTFHIPRPLRRGHRHHEVTQCAEGDRNGEAEALNGSSTKTKRKFLLERKVVTSGTRLRTA